MNGPELTREQGLLMTGSLVLIAAVAGSFALWYASSVAIPFVMALMVVYTVNPLVDGLQERMRAPRWAAIVVAFLVVGLGIFLLSLVVYSSVADLVDNGAQYEEGLQSIGDSLERVLVQADQALGTQMLADSRLELGALLANLNLERLLSTVGVGASNVVGALAGFLWNAVLVVLFAVIILAGRRPHELRAGLWGEIDRNVQQYLSVKIVASAATGVFTWLCLWILGIPLAMVFGLLAFFLNFIPSVGSLIAMVLPLPVAYLTNAGSPQIWVLALVLPGSVQFLIGNVLEPRFQGESLDLHPITVLLTLIFWGLLWGAVGAVIPVPMTAVLKMILERFETTRPVAEILAGRLPDFGT